MVLERRAVGLDLGSHTVRAVDLRLSSQGITVSGAFQALRADIVAPDAGPRDVARAVRQQLSQARISPRGVVLGLGGKDTMIRYTRVPPVPSWRLDVLMEYEVGEIQEKIGETLASAFQPLQIARDADEDQTVLIGLAKEEPLSELLAAFEAEGITVEQALLGPLAMFSADDGLGWRPDPADDSLDEEDDLLLLADMGAENLCLAVVLNSRLIFARSVTFGGRNFTDALAEQLRIRPEEAEKLKIARGGLDAAESGVLGETTRPLGMISGQLLGLLEASLRFSARQTGLTLPPLSRVVLLGGGMKLRGLDKFVARGLGKPTEFFQPSSLKLSGGLPAETSRQLAERPADFGIALGLGTAGLRDGTRGRGAHPLPSILPSKYLKLREFKDRTVFLYAAGAMLVIVLLVHLVYGMVRRSAASDTYRDLASAHAQLQQRKGEYEQMIAEARVARSRLNRLLLEAEQTSFQAHVLDLLSREMRPEMRLDRLHLDDDGLTADESTVDYTLYFECRVSNEKRQGLQWITDLQTTLESDERIATVETVSAESDRRWRMFRLLVKPSYISY